MESLSIDSKSTQIHGQRQMIDSDQALNFANRVADEAGRIAMSHFRQGLAVEHKGDDSPVTIADRNIEAYLRAEITQTFPDHGIFGEEEGAENLDRRHIWVVDPIDGTKSFITGHPLFGGLLALLDRGEPCLGQIDMPATGERWHGVAGRPSTLNGQPCRTSGRTTLADATAYTTDPLLFTGAGEAAFQALRDAVRLIRFGGDCYNYALLASGHCDLVLETGLQPYDYLPVVQVIRGAGGVITDWQGQQLTMNSAGDVLAAATPELHAAMLARLAAALGHKAA
jgi:inositol-phosphate phosphatase/L-galactose 1-phosphate phosphatase/histidinol-phosphatase